MKTFVRAYIIKDPDPLPTGPFVRGYVNETDANGNPCAITITGMIVDQNWDHQVSYRIEGEEFATLPASIGNPDPPGSPRYIAIMTLLSKFVKKRWKELDEAYQKAQVTKTVRPAAEVAALPELTPDLLNTLAPDDDATRNAEVQQDGTAPDPSTGTTPQ